MKRMLFTLFAVMAVSVSLTAQDMAESADSSKTATKVISIEQALEIALSENASVKVADMEVLRTGYARKGSYASLFPQLDGNAAYQRTIKKQVMYMDFDMPGMGGGEGEGDSSSSTAAGGGFEVGRWNTWSAGVSASMPLVNAQLWQSLKISDMDVELAVEKARSSKLEMVKQVKQAYFACLLAKEAFGVYKSVYENALANLEQTQRKYNAQKASELDLARAKTSLANAIPNVFDAENSVVLSLWQLKAVMGVDLSEEIDVDGTLLDYDDELLEVSVCMEQPDLSGNSSLRQLDIQAQQLAASIKAQEYASLPSIALSFSYSMNAMTNDFKFNTYRWSPHSYVGLSLQVPIFAGGKRANAVRQARVQADELAVQTQETERQLRIAIRQCLNTMDTAVKSYSSALSAVESAGKAYDIASKSYSVGKNTLTDLNDAQLALTQARLTSSQAVYNYLVAKANLESHIGADFTNE
ncbi:MAG: TolC family protein [Candidatus Cryptobacteroides sp.]|nr:TolC family protein [Bacteroides sp.]MDY5891600.1 TolC family protein [Candidatus Cryptobacteroides sp.]